MNDNVRIIKEISQPDFYLQISLGNKDTECRLSIKPKKTGLKLSASALLEIIKKLRITRGIKNGAINDFCNKVALGDPLAAVVIARTSLPTAGRDASLQFYVEPSSKQPHVSENQIQQKNVDIHSLNLFENVEIGKPIAKWQTAAASKDGCSVTGEIIPGAKVKDITVRLGHGVKLSDDGETITATEEGRVVYEGGVISITDQFNIRHDVDFSVGHIDFVGYVQVNGNVCDGFNIRGKKGINVRNNVRNCRIDSDGDIQINGMNGRGQGFIKCGGNLTAKYLHDATIECYGDIQVRREIINCTIKCGGSVTVAGLISSGECIALSGIEANKIGAEVGLKTKTRLTSGIDFRYVSQLKELQEEMDNNQKRLQKLVNIVGPYARHRNPASLPKDIRNKLADSLSEMQKLNKQREQNEEKLISIQKDVSDKANALINFNKILYQGTQICLGNRTETIRETIQGSHSIIEYIGLNLRILPKSPLSTNAKDIERKVLETEEKQKQKS